MRGLSKVSFFLATNNHNLFYESRAWLAVLSQTLHFLVFIAKVWFRYPANSPLYLEFHLHSTFRTVPYLPDDLYILCILDNIHNFTGIFIINLTIFIVSL